MAQNVTVTDQKQLWSFVVDQQSHYLPKLQMNLLFALVIPFLGICSLSKASNTQNNLHRHDGGAICQHKVLLRLPQTTEN